MTLTSRFTNTGIDLLADWISHPEHAQPFSVMKLGTLTDPEYSSKEYDGTETDITHCGASDPIAVLPVITVSATVAGDPGSAVAKVTGALRPNEEEEGFKLRGHRIREIGLFVDGAAPGDPVILVWIGTFPDQYIPTVQESPIDVQMQITVPIKFDNAAAVQVVTSNTLIEGKVTQLENDVATMNGQGSITPKASQADMNKASQCINKLNTGATGTTLPSINNVKQKADQSIVGDVPVKTGNQQVSPSDLWSYVKQMNGGSTAADAQEKADRKYSSGLNDDLWSYVFKLNSGSASAAEPVQKADLAGTARLINGIQSGGTSPTFPSSVNEKLNGKGGPLSSVTIGPQLAAGLLSPAAYLASGIDYPEYSIVPLINMSDSPVNILGYRVLSGINWSDYDYFCLHLVVTHVIQATSGRGTAGIFDLTVKRVTTGSEPKAAGTGMFVTHDSCGVVLTSDGTIYLSLSDDQGDTGVKYYCSGYCIGQPASN